VYRRMSLLLLSWHMKTPNKHIYTALWARLTPTTAPMAELLRPYRYEFVKSTSHTSIHFTLGKAYTNSNAVS